MNALSLPVQRLLAGAILLFVVLGLQAVLVPFVGRISSNIDQLEQLRFEIARTEALAARPRPPRVNLPLDTLIIAHDTVSAKALLTQRLETLAATGSIVFAAKPDSANAPAPHRLQLDIVLTGAEGDLRRFVGEAENGSPRVRFERWRLIPSAGDGRLTFEASAVAVWRKRT